jgi:hypothetical protein
MIRYRQRDRSQSKPSQIRPPANVTGYLIGGADYSLNDQFALKGSVAIPFKSEYSTDITLGVGYKF